LDVRFRPPYLRLDSISSVLPRHRFSDTVKAMEVHFTPEQEEQLARLATQAGIGPEHLVKDAFASASG